jgi:putative oxidoreductase
MQLNNTWRFDMIDVRTAPYAAFVLRVALGVMFIAHALLKYYVFTLPGTVQFFQSIGLPGPIAYLTFWAELIGGTLILAGAGSRWVAATWAHAGNGWVFTAPSGGWEYPAFLTVAAAVQALLGDGKYAVSALIARPGLRPAVV